MAIVTEMWFTALNRATLWKTAMVIGVGQVIGCLLTVPPELNKKTPR